MKANEFELHPEELAKVDNYSDDFKNFVSMAEKRMFETMLEHESVIKKMDAGKSDPVNHPSHYTHYKGLEVIQLTEQMNFNRGNAVKYIARAGIKDQSKEIEDLEKAKWYIQREIDRLNSKV